MRRGFRLGSEPVEVTAAHSVCISIGPVQGPSPTAGRGLNG